MRKISQRGINFFALFLLGSPRSFKTFIVFSLDLVLCFLASWFAFFLRLGEWSYFTSSMILTAVASALLALPIFFIFGLYKSIFRYNGLHAVVSTVWASFFYSISFACIFTFWGVTDVPRTIGLIQPILLLCLVGVSRLVARVWLGNHHYKTLRLNIPRLALIYGAGQAGQLLASSIANSLEIKIVGFIDDSKNLQGHFLSGLKIYSPDDLDNILESEPITDILLALPNISQNRRNEIITNLKHYKLAVRTLPAINDIVMGKVTSDVCELDVEDLLGRDPVKANFSLMHLNTIDKTILITGAGGSIGSELCRKIIKLKPKKLLLVERSEFALYEIYQELQVVLRNNVNEVIFQEKGEQLAWADSKVINQTSNQSEIEIIPLLASVCDEYRIQEIIRVWKPDTIYHAAAYKHVPLVEHNPAEGLRNNIWGTLVCARAALENGVRNFVLISTDKAVRPTNIMGASKRLSEMILQALASENLDTLNKEGGEKKEPFSSKTIFSMVRFGNVLGSSGSVVPLFRKQINNGGPITITHPEITRYFMTIPEAAELVIQAGTMALGGDVFVLDMGAPIKIYDLARRMVELSGLTVCDEFCQDGDIEIKIIGLRPGEKLHEELLISGNPESTDHPLILKAHEQFLPWATLEFELHSLSEAIAVNDVTKIRNLLVKLVSGYQSTRDVVDWVHLAIDSKN